MPFLHTEDFDDPLPSPFDGDLRARFHADPSKLTVEEYLASKYRANSGVRGEPDTSRSWDVILSDALANPPEAPKAYPYAEQPDDEEIRELAAEFFTSVEAYFENVVYGDPEPEIARQHSEHYTLQRWMHALANVGRMLRGA